LFQGLIQLPVVVLSVATLDESGRAERKPILKRPKNQEVTRVTSFRYYPFEANLRQQMWHFPLNYNCFHLYSLLFMSLKTIFS